MKNQKLEDKILEHLVLTGGLNSENYTKTEKPLKYEKILAYYKAMMKMYNVAKQANSINETVESVAMIICFSEELHAICYEGCLCSYSFLSSQSMSDIENNITQIFDNSIGVQIINIQTSCYSYLTKLLMKRLPGVNIKEDMAVTKKAISMILESCLDSKISRYYISLNSAQWFMAEDYMKQIGLNPTAENAEKHLFYKDLTVDHITKSRFWGKTTKEIGKYPIISMVPKSTYFGREIKYQIRGGVIKSKNVFFLVRIENDYATFIDGPFNKKTGIQV